MPPITRADLMRFAPHASITIADAILAKADAVLPMWGIDTPERLWMFMAHASVESAGFTALFENLNYSAERLVAVWPNRFPTVAAAQPFAHNPQALANKVYGGRLGNTGPNDGWLHRGQGLLQITGQDNFERLARAMGVTVPIARAMITSDGGMLECAAATFGTWGCLPFADHADMLGCTRAINGGVNGLADRQAAYALAKRVWPSIDPAPALIATAAPVVLPPAPVPVASPRHIDNVAPAPAPRTLGQWFADTFFRRIA